jgi:signal transduction histidine kinase
VADQPAPEPITAWPEEILEAATDGILLIDLQRRIVRCNSQYLRLFGLASEIVLQGIDAIVEAAPALETPGDILASSAPVWSDPRLDLSDVVRFADGRVYERRIAPLRVAEVLVGRVVTFRNITQRARAELALEQHRAFLEKAQEVAHIGSWVSELDGSGRLAWSAESHRIFNVPESEFPGTTAAFFARVHPADRDAVRAARDAAVAGIRPYDIEHRIVGPGNTIRWVHERADVVREHGRAVRMVGTVQDITERRLLEDQLRQSQKMEAIGRLAGGIAHDLNNALTAIAGYTELALGQLSSHHVARADVEEIRRAAERAGSVTRQLLAFSRKELLEPRLFDLNDTIGAIARLLDRLLGANVEVRTELAPDLPAILGDPGQVEQAIINLAVNARDAMPSGGRLLLSTSLDTVDEEVARANPPMGPGVYVGLRVSDNGQGMSPETQARIFEPFFTTKEAGKGTGLGLSMVYGTLKQIGGFIFVDSEPKRGTTFRLYFRPAGPSLAGRTALRPQAGDDVIEARQTVLVAEDDPAVRNLVSSALRTEGYRLLVTGSAEEALDVAAANPDGIDLLLTDATMPGKSGIELAGALKGTRPGLRVIVMSGYTEETLHGFNDRMTLLQKPFAPKELRRRVREALDQVRKSSR